MKPLNTDTAERVGDIQTSATSNKQAPAKGVSVMNHYAALRDLFKVPAITKFFNLISDKCLYILYIIRGKP